MIAESASPFEAVRSHSLAQAVHPKLHCCESFLYTISRTLRRVLADGVVWKPRSRPLPVAEQQQLVGNEEMPLRMAVQHIHLYMKADSV
jgi:hypothetical protein